MATIGVPLNIGQLPYSCYPSDPQTLYADMFNRARALYPSITGVVISASAPAASDSDKLWIKTSGGAPVGQFIRYNAEWVWPHEVPASGNERRLWVGSLVDLDTYDGGAAGAVGAATGPFWTRDTAFNDRLLIGVGPTLAAAVATNYGDADASIVLTEAQLPQHAHKLVSPTAQPNANPVTATSYIQQNGGVSGGNENYQLTASTTEASNGLSSNIGSGAAVNILNPCRSLYIIQRTARIYRVG